MQIGAVQSVYGVLGTWTTSFHEVGDPVGELLMLFFTCVSASKAILFGRSYVVAEGARYCPSYAQGRMI